MTMLARKNMNGGEIVPAFSLLAFTAESDGALRYGLAVKTGEETRMYHDVSGDIVALRQWIETIQSGQVSVSHVFDLVEDFVRGQGCFFAPDAFRRSL